MVIVLAEDFATNKLSEYTFEEATSAVGMVVAGGVLSFTDANNHAFYDPTVTVGDSFQSVKVHRGAGEWPPLVGLAFKRVTETDRLLLFTQEGKLRIYTQIAGSATVLAEPEANFTLGVDEWLWVEMSGNVIKWGISPTEPEEGSRTGTEHELTLSGEAASVLGAGIEGLVGLRLASYKGGFFTNATTLTDWTVQVAGEAPLTITNPGAQENREGTPLSIKIKATGATEYLEERLPAGLTIDGSNGKIEGTPTTVEEPKVKITVKNAKMEEQSCEFTWAILPEKALGGSNIVTMTV